MTDTICPECGSSDRALRERTDLVAEVNRLIEALDEAELDVADLRADLARARADLAAAHLDLTLLSPVVSEPRPPILKEAK